jgi:uncharacterized protein (UPF0276 family)
MKFGLSIRHWSDPQIEKVLNHPDVDFVEIAAEDFLYRSDVIAKRRLDWIHNHKPVSVHGYTLSLFDPEPWSPDRLELHQNFFSSHDYLALSDHYAISSWRGRWLGSLSPAPTQVEAQQIAIERLETIQSQIPDVPFFLENVAAPFLVPNQTSTFEAFSQITSKTRTKVLLDISNLEANQTNFKISAEEELRKFATLPVGEVHLAGGERDGGFFRDSHSTAVSPTSWQLFSKIKSRLPEDTLVLIEWEQRVDAECAIGEVTYARNI